MALINLLRDLVEHGCGHPLGHRDVRHGLDVEVLGVDHAAAVIVPPRDPEHGRVRHQHLHQSEASITTLGPIRGQYYNTWTNQRSVLQHLDQSKASIRTLGPIRGQYYNTWTKRPVLELLDI